MPSSASEIHAVGEISGGASVQLAGTARPYRKVAAVFAADAAEPGPPIAEPQAAQARPRRAGVTCEWIRASIPGRLGRRERGVSHQRGGTVTHGTVIRMRRQDQRTVPDPGAGSDAASVPLSLQGFNAETVGVINHTVGQAA